METRLDQRSVNGSLLFSFSVPICPNAFQTGECTSHVFFWNGIQYLGHVVSAQGVHVSPEYTKVFRDWPIPNTLRALRASLGKCGYYHRFIAAYATIAAPLIQYTHRDQHKHIPRLAQDATAVQAFQELKRRLLNAPILAYP